MDAITMVWQQETDHLTCRWSAAVGQRADYHPSWMQDASADVQERPPVPSFLDFTRHSPFGRGDWYSPYRLRSPRPQ